MKKTYLFSALLLTVLLVFAGCASSAPAEDYFESSTGEPMEEQAPAEEAAYEGPVYGAGDITFVYYPSPGEDLASVSVAGTMNDWNPGNADWQMELQDDGSYALTAALEPGEYLYKFVFDGGNWPGSMLDLYDVIGPEPSNFVDDGFGGRNAVLVLE
jgi:hypothetical protein